MRILFIADLVGDDAIHLVGDVLPRLKQQYQIDCTIANGENADKGKGIIDRQVQKLKTIGVDCVTSGNHIWDPRKKEVLVKHAGYLLRPLNYPEGNLGIGSQILKLKNGIKIGVLNLQGRSFMFPIDCPFRSGEKAIRQLRSETPIIIVDFHAEATAEKQALAWYFDGKVSAVVGTHTHVQTADERILPNGSAYITDAGMTGPIDSIIGMDPQKAIQRFILQSQVYYAMSKSKEYRFNGVLIDVDETNGKAIAIKRLNFSKKEFFDESNLD
ncbi:MAG: TIGR00282 family metallophosphoesterase [Calditrichaeota bacterium]|nr:MAG: TIGR00282 family metallophosphoesterase [Calditrichota bacterium]